MGRPPVETLFEPVTCFPTWYPRYLPFAQGTRTVASGCRTSGGSVQCDPKAMAAAASKVIGRTVSLEAYTLARYLASEVGNGSLAEKVCVAQDAINRVRYAEPNTRTLTALLLYRQPAGCPNRGYYGPIHDDNAAPRPECRGNSNNPYGRWASTSRDPSMGDLVIALGVLSGDIDPWFSKGADDQLGPSALKARGNDPVASVRSHATNSRQYWVGPIYGINPWTTFQYRTMPEIAPTSAAGQALIQRGMAAMQSGAPNWTGFEACAPRHRAGLIATAGVAFGVGVGALLWLTRRKPTPVPS